MTKTRVLSTIALMAAASFATWYLKRTDDNQNRIANRYNIKADTLLFKEDTILSIEMVNGKIKWLADSMESPNSKSCKVVVQGNGSTRRIQKLMGVFANKVVDTLIDKYKINEERFIIKIGWGKGYNETINWRATQEYEEQEPINATLSASPK